MKIVTYLGFTLLSIFIQFSVMDFIQGMLKLDDKPSNLQGTSPKRQLKDVLKNISYKPHAIYYRTPTSKQIKNHSPAKLFSNNTLLELFATTDISTTVFDILYDENTTATDETFTTESLYTSTEIENVTEIALFEKSNGTTTKTDTLPKKIKIKDCHCNILFRVCDINCCCDDDCLDSELELFPNCAENKIKTNELNDDICVSQLPYFGYGHGLFCIVKINLPEKRNLVIQKTDHAPTEHFLTWKRSGKTPIIHEFSNKLYTHGDPIWLLNNGTYYHTDLPTPKVNNYCTGRKAIQFLKDEEYRCNVKIRDIEMFQIIKSLDETTVISATSLSMNSSALNCTTLHCVNWTIIVCKNLLCSNYNNSLHEPQCTETLCTNIALKLDYFFYYHDSKIINASIILHVQNLKMDIPFMLQEIKVKFVLANQTIDTILQLSGNPGYLDGLPVIVSFEKNNYTDTFFKNTQGKRHLILPGNENGICISPNISENLILFGQNRRIQCRYNHKFLKLSNNTEECKNIQNSIIKLSGLNISAAVSPFGNPQQLKDEDWVSIEKSLLFVETLYGRVQDKSLKLLCYNLVTRYSVIISYANINGLNRILSCKFQITARNATFNMEDITTVVTIDISFIDLTKPSIIEYAVGPPNLNIHLPDDFFYPFRSNESRVKYNVFTIILLYSTVIILSK